MRAQSGCRNARDSRRFGRGAGTISGRASPPCRCPARAGLSPGNEIRKACRVPAVVKDAIREIVGAEISLIDTGAAVAKQLKNKLEEKGLLSTSTEKAEVHFWTNSDAENAEQVTEKLWGNHVAEHRL